MTFLKVLLLSIFLGVIVRASARNAVVEPAQEKKRKVLKKGGSWCHTRACGGEMEDRTDEHGNILSRVCPTFLCGDALVDQIYHECRLGSFALMKTQDGKHICIGAADEKGEEF
jgi:hypothetical protein